MVALGINLIIKNSRIVLSIYKLTCEDEKKINPEVWHTGKEAGRLDMNPISIEIERPEDPIKVKQYPIPLEGRRGLKPIIEDLINKGILEPSEGSRDFFAFQWEDPETNRKQQLRWASLPQRFVDLPNLFRQALEQLLSRFSPRKRTKILQYVDNLLVAGETEEDVRECTIELLNFLGEKGLKVSKQKLQFTEPETWDHWTVVSPEPQLKVPELNSGPKFPSGGTFMESGLGVRAAPLSVPVSDSVSVSVLVLVPVLVLILVWVSVQVLEILGPFGQDFQFPTLGWVEEEAVRKRKMPQDSQADKELSMETREDKSPRQILVEEAVFEWLHGAGIQWGGKVLAIPGEKRLQKQITRI
ncbi:hypothetical protein DUI87_35558 [Hirundo rustica rustica]|uniref:ribonuclease H n=1 Tax=Hirundo rustica rustica TaxID=333673 RepID=A0A3M0J092_HIRRU|nr:hypothetical protein DUI87_35558 [Hirundo rustica rustica]